MDVFSSWNERTLSDFVERFWNYDMIALYSENEVIERYKLFEKKINTIRARIKLQHSSE